MIAESAVAGMSRIAVGTPYPLDLPEVVSMLLELLSLDAIRLRQVNRGLKAAVECASTSLLRVRFQTWMVKMEKTYESHITETEIVSRVGNLVGRWHGQVEFGMDSLLFRSAGNYFAKIKNLKRLSLYNVMGTENFSAHRQLQFLSVGLNVVCPDNFFFAFLSSLAGLPVLEYLKVTEFRVLDSTAEDAGSVFDLRVSKSLRRLSLRGTLLDRRSEWDIEDETCFDEKLCQWLPKGLEDLELMVDGLKGSKSLCSLAHSDCLRRLTLQSRTLHPSISIALNESLPHFNSLEHLTLEDFEPEDKIAFALSKVSAHNKIKELHLSRVRFDSADVEYLTAAFRKLSGLRVVSYHEASIHNTAVIEALANGFRGLSNLEKLQVSGVDTRSTVKLCSVLRRQAQVTPASWPLKKTDEILTDSDLEHHRRRVR
jgi:hypothetical protein